MQVKYRARRTAVLVALWFATIQASPAQTHAPASSPLIEAVAGVSTTVADMDRSVAFYTKVLSFEKTSDQEFTARGDSSDNNVMRLRVVRIRLGDETIELIQVKGKLGRPVPADSRSNDRWFQHIAIIVSDMDRAYAVLNANRVEPASIAPQRLPDWNKNAAGIRAFYFKDPDGHPLEILQFPPGKGDPKWKVKSGKLFLGIDHTAIVVNDTGASLKFYCDLLGLRIVAASENYGPEQERLNNVPGAHLRITSLRAPQGPGIELLEYVSPRNRRQLPFQPNISDIIHRQTVLVASDPAMLAKALQTLSAERAKLTGRGAFVVYDPDGHELLVRPRESNSDEPGSKYHITND